MAAGAVTGSLSAMTEGYRAKKPDATTLHPSPSRMAAYFARKSAEVLIEGGIPPEAILGVIQ